MAQVDGFLADVLPRQHAAIGAMCRGDAAPWRAMWSRGERVSIFGALGTARGAAAVRGLTEAVASRYTEAADLEFEVVDAGAGEDLAYVVGLERKTAVFDGVLRTSTLRVTHVYRHEDGQWRVVHRHGDHPPEV